MVADAQPFVAPAVAVEPAEEFNDEIDVAFPSVPSAVYQPPPPQAPLNYQAPAQPPARPTHPVPDYKGLLWVSSLLMILSVMFYLAAVGILAIGFYGLSVSRPPTSRFAPEPAPVFLSMLAVSGTLVAAGVVYHGLSAAAKALRDIAQNSFNR